MAIWFGKQREKEVMRLCIVHADKILNTVMHMKEVVYSFCDNDIEAAKGAFQQVFDSEREADVMKRRILEELSKGPFLPIDREDVMRLVMTADDVGANAKSASRKINFSSSMDFGDFVKAGLKELADMLVEIVSKMKEAIEVLLRDTKEATKLADELEALEEKIDDHRVELLVKIMKIGDRTESFSSWLMLKEAVENMENVADRSEDVADVIRIMAVSHT
jgi:predicted phosphate transport protein (TIGR00153 family)